jgi:hypothetical protein
VKRFWPAAVFILLLAFFPATLLAALQEPQRSVSTSRQFIVYGSDPQLRGVICDIAEQTKKAALALLQEHDAWRIPILIRVQHPQANLPELPPAHLNISQTGVGLKLQLELTLGSDVTAAAIERELLRAVFLEMMYREQPNTPAGTAYVEPPEWLLAGTLATAAGREAAPVVPGRVTPLPEFLRQNPALLDSPSRALYREYSAALVTALRDAPEGRRRLARFVGNLPQASNDPVADLLAHFPSLGGTADEMQQKWQAAVADRSATDRFRMLSCAETERQLALALQIALAPRQGAATIYGVDEFASFIKDPLARPALARANEQLLLLSGRAHPLFAPVISEYQRIVLELTRGKTKRLEQRLAELRATREQLARRMDAVADYLNWFEATQSRTVSGAFNDYIKAAELAQSQTPRRRDRISVYLDALEAQF